MVNWTDLANSRVYKSPKEMFQLLYVVNKRSLSEIAQDLGVSKASVFRELKKLKIKLRNKGGRNNVVQS